MNATMLPLRVLDGIARRSWIAGTLCVLVCAALAGRAAAHAIDWQLGEPTAAFPRAAAGPPPPPPVRDVRDDVAPAAFTDRNVFCSDCAPRVAGDPPSASDAVAATRLPLVLLATSLAISPAASTATLRNTASGAEGAFGVGQRVPGAGALEKVSGTYVWIKNDATGATERVELLALAAAPEPPPGPIASTTPGKAAPWADRIRAIDAQTWEVDRELIRELVSAQGKAGGARLAPTTRDGKLAGVRVNAVRKDSVASALGLRNGDVIEAIDGKALDSPDALLQMYADLDRASAVQLSVARGGKPLKLGYQLR